MEWYPLPSLVSPRHDFDLGSLFDWSLLSESRGLQIQYISAARLPVKSGKFLLPGSAASRIMSILTGSYRVT